MCDNIYMEDKIFNLLTFKGKTIFFLKWFDRKYTSRFEQIRHEERYYE